MSGPGGAVRLWDLCVVLDIVVMGSPCSHNFFDSSEEEIWQKCVFRFQEISEKLGFEISQLSTNS